MTDRPQGTVLTYRMVLAHAGVLAAVGATLLWLGQTFYFPRSEAIAIIEQIKTISDNARLAASSIKEVQATLTDRLVVFQGLQERQAAIADILKDIKEELKDLRKAR